HCVCKRVLVTNDMASGPPTLHVRISFAGYLNGSKAALQSFVNVKLELVHSLQIKHNTSATTVNLKTIVVLSSGGKSRRFERAHCPVRKLHKGQGGVIHLYRRHGATFRQVTFSDESFK